MALRRKLVHKARPAPQVMPFSVKPSSKTLTEPMTPQFRSKALRTMV
jgi:hypothetical protein